MGFLILKKTAFYCPKLHLPVCLKGGLSKIKILSPYFAILYNRTVSTRKRSLPK